MTQISNDKLMVKLIFNFSVLFHQYSFNIHHNISSILCCQSKEWYTSMEKTFHYILLSLKISSWWIMYTIRTNFIKIKQLMYV